MKPRSFCLALTVLALGVSLRGQTPDVNKVLADARAALGGEKKLASLKTLAATGQSVRVTPEGSAAPTDFEMAFELPDKFMKKEALAVMGPATITRTTGFNADTPIDVVDQPPAPAGSMRFVFRGPGDADGPQTPEQQAATQKKAVIAAKQDFSRLLLGFIASPSAAYPLEFSYSGQAESPDGKADVIDVRGEGDFAARLFIDSNTHLPLMLTWMAKEPLIIRRTMTSPGGPPPAAGGHLQTATPEERDKMMKDAQQAAKEAETKARVVEYRLYYGDYRDVDGVKVPFRLQRAIDGKPTEEVTLEKVKVNGKVDPRKFEIK